MWMFIKMDVTDPHLIFLLFTQSPPHVGTRFARVAIITVHFSFIQDANAVTLRVWSALFGFFRPPSYKAELHGACVCVC